MVLLNKSGDNISEKINKEVLELQIILNRKNISIKEGIYSTLEEKQKKDLEIRK